MVVEANKTIIRRYVEEILGNGNGDAAAALTSDDGVARWLSAEWLPKLHRAFPDWHATLDDMIAEGDEVAVRVTMRGTHTGTLERGTLRGIPEGWELPDLPPTGKPLVQKIIAIYYLVDGKWDVHWPAFNTLDLLNQLDAIPHLMRVAR